MRRGAILALVVAALVASPARADVLVALAPGVRPPADALPVAPRLRIWRVPDREARGLRGVLASGGDRHGEELAVAAGPTDPLVPQEWWLPVVGADRAQPPPGPGRPVAVIDTGVDTTTPEFSATTILLLDQQHVTPGPEKYHGTAVASIVGAPADGRGMIGVYPGATLMSYDAGGQTLAEVLSGIAAAIEQPGPGVINLSVGFTGASAASLLGVAVDSAYAAGWLVVSAAGNGGQQGSPPVYPADLPHVLTVAATDRSGAVAPFSSRSAFVDLAAPGVGILAAVPTWYAPSGYAQLTGTSFAAPIVSGAAAWVWTARPQLDVTQLFELLRRSATDIDAPGFDDASGWGLLNIPAALAAPAPVRDPQEPNDDIDLVAQGGLFGVGTQPLVDARHRTTHVQARLDPSKDPADVYRLWVPAGSAVEAQVQRGARVELALWGPLTRSIHERRALARRDLLDTGRFVLGRNGARRGAYWYLAATLQPGAPETTYLVSVRLTARP